MGNNGASQCKAVPPPQQFTQGDKIGIITTDAGTATIEAGENFSLQSGIKRTFYPIRSGEKYLLSKMPNP